MAPPETMRAYQYSHFKGRFEDNLKISTIPTLQPPKKPSQKNPSVLVSVSSIALNPADYKTPETPLIGRLVNRKPATPCLDFAGTIVQIPDSINLSGFKPGDRVFGRLDFFYQHGTLAEYVLAQPSGLAYLPPNVSTAQGAAIGTAAITAYQSLVPYLKPGDYVFINGASGGVGTFTVQMAKLLGAAHVTVSCSAANASLCQELGADEVIDYRNFNLEEELKRRATQGRVFDLIVDNVGSGTSGLYADAHLYLKEGKPYVQVSNDLNTLTDIVKTITRMLLPSWLGGGKRPWVFLLAKNDPAALEKIVQWVSSGKLKVVIDSEYGFEDANRAFARLRTKRARGKVVVNVA